MSPLIEIGLTYLTKSGCAMAHPAHPGMTGLKCHTGKSLSEALIFASTNPQYDDRLFIKVQYMKIPSSNLGRTCCVQKLFRTFRTICVHNMFSPGSEKRRASEKDLPVL